VVGLLGLLLVPVTNPESTLLGQILGAATIFFWVFLSSLLVWTALKFTIGLRVDPEEEYNGVDLSECGMEAYPEFTNA
jgi:Amt family ammonium transporter